MYKFLLYIFILFLRKDSGKAMIRKYILSSTKQSSSIALPNKLEDIANIQHDDRKETIWIEDTLD